jgi:replicative DNA helicase
MLDTPDPQYPFLKIEKIIQQYLETPLQIERDYPGLYSGIKRLDEFTGGFQPGELVIVSGYPFMGQEAFLECVALNVAFKQKLPVAYFSLSKKRWKLAESLMAKMARVDHSRLATGHLTKEDEKKVQLTQNNFREMSLYINDSNGITVHDFRRHLDECLNGKYHVKPTLIIVDYLQLIQGCGDCANRKDEIETTLYELEDTSRSKNVPIIIHSLLYPDCRSRRCRDPNQRPILADLMNSPETAMIDKYADTVLFFHRDIIRRKDGEPEPDENKLEVISEKSRNGHIGTVYLDFDTLILK